MFICLCVESAFAPWETLPCADAPATELSGLLIGVALSVLLETTPNMRRDVLTCSALPQKNGVAVTPTASGLEKLIT